MATNFTYGIPQWALDYARLNDRCVQSLTLSFSNKDFTQVTATFIGEIINIKDDCITVLGEKEVR